MNEQEVLKILKKVGAIVDGHFVLQRGDHSSIYVQKDAVFPRLEDSDALARALAEQFTMDEVEVTIGPAVGGALFARDVARELQCLTQKKVHPVYAEKIGKTKFTPTMHKQQPFGLQGEQQFAIGRGYDRLVAGKNVLAIEDLLTTGDSAKQVIEAVRACGGNVVGLGALWNRGGVRPEDVGNVPKLFSLINVDLEKFDPADCPLCKADVPINMELGYGRDFLLKKARNIRDEFRDEFLS